MSIRKILKWGNPILCKTSNPVKNYDDSLKNLIQDLKDTITGVAISAPQIGINLNVVLIGFKYHPHYPNETPIPLTVFINPEIEPVTEEKILSWEGCSSVPGIRGQVLRYKKIKYKASDEEGNPIEGELENFPARILQHEKDHLDGYLFVHRVRIEDRKICGFEETLREEGIYPWNKSGQIWTYDIQRGQVRIPGLTPCPLFDYSLNEIKTIELFTDGYFAIPKDISLEAWEKTFEKVEQEDSDKWKKYKSTKFKDDRTIAIIEF